MLLSSTGSFTVWDIFRKERNSACVFSSFFLFLTSTAGSFDLSIQRLLFVRWQTFFSRISLLNKSRSFLTNVSRHRVMIWLYRTGDDDIQMLEHLRQWHFQFQQRRNTKSNQQIYSFQEELISFSMGMSGRRLINFLFTTETHMGRKREWQVFIFSS